MFNWLKRLLFGEKRRTILTHADKPAAPPDLDFQQERTAYHRALDPADLPGLACPACGAAVGAVEGPYLAAALADDGAVLETFLIGGDFVYYCPACPTVVVDTFELNEYIRLADDVSGEVYVMGYVDLDAVPESQQELPVSEIDLPLTPFLVNGLQIREAPRRPARKRKRRRKKWRRR
jgi:hypothetical protein